MKCHLLCENVQNRHVFRDRQYISDFWGGGGWGWMKSDC